MSGLEEIKYADTLGVSAIVRIKYCVWLPMIGKVGMIISQNSAGRQRYRVMVPGSPYAVHASADDLELVQGITEDWWNVYHGAHNVNSERKGTSTNP